MAAVDFFALPTATTTDPGLLSASDKTTIDALGTLSTQDADAVAITGGAITGITDLAIADGGTGASSASAARTNLGLGTAATHNVPASGDAAAGEVVLGNDSRLGTGGASAYEDLSDVDTTGLADGDVMIWDATAGLWKPGTVSGGGGGGVTTSSGAYASRPASGTTAGDLYLATDSPIQSRWSGSAWEEWAFGFKLTAPPAPASWTWINQNDASASATKGGLLLTIPTTTSAGDGNVTRGLLRSTPATPYTVTAGILPVFAPVSYRGAGILLKNSGGNPIIVFMAWYNGGSLYFSVRQNASSIAFGSEVYSAAANPMTMGPMIWMRVADDGTTRTYSYSLDSQNFVPVYSHARTTHITPDQIGVCAHYINTSSLSPSYVNLLSWEGA